MNLLNKSIRNLRFFSTAKNKKIYFYNNNKFAKALSASIFLLGSSCVLLNQNVIHAEGLNKIEIKNQDLNTAFRQEPSSKRKIPLKISNQYDSFYEVGTGIRCVTFLNVSVYVVSFYLSEKILNSIKSSSNWKDFTSAAFLKKEEFGNWYVRDLCERMQGSMMIRIEPVKNTNGAHLKRGFNRFLLPLFERDKITMSPNDQAIIKKTLEYFDKEFPLSVVKEGTQLYFTKTSDNKFIVEIDGSEVMSIDGLGGKWMGERFFEAYLDNANPPSEVARKSFACGIENLVQL
ncbi:hypothetical protein HDU92_008796 [Lobulomyces angularis]|nr:hypothetical protein HDU92_008796 [Lobulomyces angularis]